jgi:hypothetical protein
MTATIHPSLLSSFPELRNNIEYSEILGAGTEQSVKRFSFGLEHRGIAVTLPAEESSFFSTESRRTWGPPISNPSDTWNSFRREDGGRDSWPRSLFPGKRATCIHLAKDWVGTRTDLDWVTSRIILLRDGDHSVSHWAPFDLACCPSSPA